MVVPICFFLEFIYFGRGNGLANAKGPSSGLSECGRGTIGSRGFVDQTF
jgi:hypothetical protein